MALVNANDYIEKVELVNANANFIPNSDWFGNDTTLSSLSQPAERYRITFKDLSNFGSKTLCFGELMKWGALLDATFTNIKGLKYEKDKMYNIFNYPFRFGQYVLLQYRNGDFVIPGYGFQEFNQVLNNYLNVENGTDTSGSKYVEITLPYITYFTLNAHIEDYQINALGSMRSCAVNYSDLNFESEKAFAIVEGWVEDFYYDDFDFETDGKNENVFYFNERTETKTQEEFIQEQFNCIEYSEAEGENYGFYFNIPFSTLTFKDVSFPMGGTGVSSYFVPIKDLNSKITRKLCNINKFVIPNFKGPYLDEFDESAVLTNENTSVMVDDGEFNQLANFLYSSNTNPEELLKYMNVINTEIYRKSDDNASGLSANWGYKDAYFVRVKFTFDISKFIDNLDSYSYFIFYFPKLVQLKKVSKNYLTLPTAEHYEQYLDEEAFIFSFQQPGGASSNYLDSDITTTGVNNDYCVSIHNATLTGEIEVVNAEEWSRDGNLFTITTSIPLINHCLISSSYESELYNNSIQCVSDLFNQSLLCTIIYHKKNYYLNGFIPPYYFYKFQNNEKYLELFQKVYESSPDENVKKYFKEIYTINSSQDELTIYQKYANWYQNDGLRGGAVWANVFCRSWKFRNIPLASMSKVSNNNNFNLATIPIFAFDIVPSFPENTYGDDYCPSDTVNECLILPNDSIDYQNVSELYENREDTDVIRLESYIKHIPLESIQNDLLYELLGLYVGFGTVWKRGG